MSSDNSNDKFNQGNIGNAMGVSEKKIVLRMVKTFKQNKDMVGLRRFLGTKMNLDVQEVEECIVRIDENQDILRTF